MSFNDLERQKPIANQLQWSLQRGRLAHAYLFTGPRGSGKQNMARALAKALNCAQREHDSCDCCDSCQRIDEGAHPDVYWVRPESKSRRILVDKIHEFANSINLKPMMGRMKVGVIVDADCMGEEASNAFLKTLEEPPPQTSIVLLSAEPQRLLPTIVSRCLKLSFGSVAVAPESAYREKVLALLARFCPRGEEKIAQTYQLLAEIHALLQEIRDETRSRIEAELNLDRYKELDPKLRDQLEKQMEARIEGEYRTERERVLEEIYRWFGDVLLCVEGVQPQFLSRPNRIEAARRAAGGLTYEQASRNLDAIEQVRESLSRNISEMLALEVGLLRLAL